jgi:hypothetical protein
MRGQGCRIRWDLVHARALWDSGVRIRDIATEVGTTEAAINGAAIRWDWPSRSKPPRTRRPTVKRCPGCLAVYEAAPEDNRPHCFASIQSIYIGAGA